MTCDDAMAIVGRALLIVPALVLFALVVGALLARLNGPRWR